MKIHQFTEHLTQRIGSHKYDMWFRHLDMKVDGSSLDISTDNAFVARWIDSHFSNDLQDVATSLLGKKARIKVHVVNGSAPQTTSQTIPGREDSSSEQVQPKDRSPYSINQSHPADRSHAGRRRRHKLRFRRLSEYVVGSCNQLAYTAACKFTEGDENLGLSPLFIHGGCGVGKTHLLQGICHRARSRHGSRLKLRYVTGEQFTNEYINAVRHNTLDSFRHRIRQLDLLAIDDIHFLENKVRTQNEFLHTLDNIGLNRSRLVLASDEHPQNIKRFSQALVSRFMSGMVVRIDAPNRSTRIELIHRLAKNRALRLSEGAVELMATHFAGSVRELEGAITKLSALASIHKSYPAPSPDYFTPELFENGPPEVGISLVRQLISENTHLPTRPIQLKTIVEVVCRALEIDKHELLDRSRHRHLVLGRSLVAYLGRELTTHSYPEIAQFLGRRHHSTIHTAAVRFRRQLQNQEKYSLRNGQPLRPLQDLVEELRATIRKEAASLSSQP